MSTTNNLAKKIESELDRLDSYNNGQGIICAVKPSLPQGYVMICDSTTAVYGPAAEILASLEEVEYDPQKIVGQDDPYTCYDPKCYGGSMPEDESKLHGHDGDPILAKDSDTGFVAAWDALSEFSDSAPQFVSDWPTELVETELLEERTVNDEPITLITVSTNAGVRYTAGPHGVFTCALHDALAHDALRQTREEAIAQCEFVE